MVFNGQSVVELTRRILLWNRYLFSIWRCEMLWIVNLRRRYHVRWYIQARACWHSPAHDLNSGHSPLQCRSNACLDRSTVSTITKSTVGRSHILAIGPKIRRWLRVGHPGGFSFTVKYGPNYEGLCKAAFHPAPQKFTWTTAADIQSRSSFLGKEA